MALSGQFSYALIVGVRRECFSLDRSCHRFMDAANPNK
jgi:hypothetical protein